MPEYHFIADDLGIDRNYKYNASGPNAKTQEDWLEDAAIDVESGFLHRLQAEFRMDEFDG